MPKRLTRASLTNLALLATVVYLLGAWLIPPRYFIEILNGLFLGLVASVTIVFFPLFIRAIQTKNFDRVSQLTIGIMLTWFSLIVSRSLNTAGRIGGDIATIANSQFVSVAAYLAIIGGILHITAPGMVEDRLRYNRGLLVLSGVIGAAVAVVAIYLQRNGA